MVLVPEDEVTGKETNRPVGWPCMFPPDESEIGCENPGNWTWRFCIPVKLCNWESFKLWTFIVLDVCWGLDIGDWTVFILEDCKTNCWGLFGFWRKDCDVPWEEFDELELASFSNKRELLLELTMSGLSAAGVPTKRADKAVCLFDSFEVDTDLWLIWKR